MVRRYAIRAEGIALYYLRRARCCSAEQPVDEFGAAFAGPADKRCRYRSDREGPAASPPISWLSGRATLVTEPTSRFVDVTRDATAALVPNRLAILAGKLGTKLLITRWRPPTIATKPRPVHPG